eukprot:3787974-Amphidinium_carterae.2
MAASRRSLTRLWDLAAGARCAGLCGHHVVLLNLIRDVSGGCKSSSFGPSVFAMFSCILNVVRHRGCERRQGAQRWMSNAEAKQNSPCVGA